MKKQLTIKDIKANFEAQDTLKDDDLNYCEHCNKNKKDSRFESITETNICDRCLKEVKQ